MKKLYRKLAVLTVIMLCPVIMAKQAYSAIPITTDSRIKTLVYNENEVFQLTLHYGYQSNIEFANNEEIETLSVGNSYSWKITPVGRRLFIKPLEGAARTNMTVITNKRTYQFEIQSKDPNDSLDDELVYVVRFFYPDPNFAAQQPKIDTAAFAPQIIQPQAQIVPQQFSQGSGQSQFAMPQVQQQGAFNFNYSITGPDAIAPLKIFDDGKQLFMQFPNNNASIPYIFTVDAKNKETSTTYSRQDEYIVIKSVPQRLVLKLDNNVVNVFKEGR